MIQNVARFAPQSFSESEAGGLPHSRRLAQQLGAHHYIDAAKDVNS